MEQDRTGKPDEKQVPHDQNDESLTFLMLLCIMFGPLIVGAFFAMDKHPLLASILLVLAVVWPIYLWIDRPRM
jgi:hypothetical protein